MTTARRHTDGYDTVVAERADRTYMEAVSQAPHHSSRVLAAFHAEGREGALYAAYVLEADRSEGGYTQEQREDGYDIHSDAECYRDSRI